MKIAILVCGLPPNYNGGTEIATVEIAKEAVNQGHEVHVIAINGKNKPYQPQFGYKVHSIKSIPVPYLYGLVALPSIVLSVLKIKPDIIHAQGSQMGVSAFVASLITKIPFMFYGRGEIYVEWFMKSIITKILMKYASRAIAQTESMAKELYSYYRREIEVIPNGIDAEKFDKVSKYDARLKLKLPWHSKIVLWVGNDRPEKNLSLFYKVKESLFSDNILCIAITNKSHDEALMYMAAADVFVNTSFSEGFPMTILEAMASGLPIVYPDICGLKDIVKRGGIATDGSYLATAGAILDILNTKEMADNMSDCNRNRVKSYTWENVVKRLY
jgi:glycosyltransferase involved in cell wall biosynthesis